MPYRPRKSNKAQRKAGELENQQTRANKLSGQRYHAMATRSTLSRLRNRKSDLK